MNEEFVDIRVGEGKSGEKACAKLVKKLKKSWNKCDIILWKLSSLSWAAYSIENNKDKLFIKAFEQEEGAI